MVRCGLPLGHFWVSVRHFTFYTRDSPLLLARTLGSSSRRLLDHACVFRGLGGGRGALWASVFCGLRPRLVWRCDSLRSRFSTRRLWRVEDTLLRRRLNSHERVTAISTLRFFTAIKLWTGSWRVMPQDDTEVSYVSSHLERFSLRGEIPRWKWTVIVAILWRVVGNQNSSKQSSNQIKYMFFQNVHL